MCNKYYYLGTSGEKVMATLSSTVAWKIPWMEEPGRLKSMGSLRVRHKWATSLSLFTFTHWRRKWQPTPVFLTGESQGRRAWWAAVYEVTQSRTRLNRLSSRSSRYFREEPKQRIWGKACPSRPLKAPWGPAWLQCEWSRCNLLQGMQREQENSHLEWPDPTAISPVFILIQLANPGSWFSMMFCDFFSKQKDPSGSYLLLFPMCLFSHSFLGESGNIIFQYSPTVIMEKASLLGARFVCFGLKIQMKRLVPSAQQFRGV